jgi:mRNA interferase RelE/StbE
VKVQYRQLFLKDLKKLKKTDLYDSLNERLRQRFYEFAFTTLPEVETLTDFPNIKAMVGYLGYYRFRFGDYRIGFILTDDALILMRILHRREFYRYFP